MAITPIHVAIGRFLFRLFQVKVRRGLNHSLPCLKKGNNGIGSWQGVAVRSAGVNRNNGPQTPPKTPHFVQDSLYRDISLN
jgi:hypothetical protein